MNCNGIAYKLKNCDGMNPINLFLKGAKLGKKLERITDYSARWKVIADFWSEMILFVAPSDNVRGHIERLTHGGEFITRLWALLTHAGIVEQQKEKQNV